MNKRMTLLWLLLGLGSDLQLVASLSITEVFVLLIAPFVFLHESAYMRKNGVLPLFLLSVCVILGCCVSSLANNTPFPFFLRGMAVTVLVSCSVVVAHWVLRRDPSGFKWYILAIPISSALSTFIFKSTVEVDMLGESAAEIMSGPTYWIKRLSPLFFAPIKGWYLKMPTAYNVCAPIFVAGFSLLTSISGRGSAVRSVCFAVLALFGGKKRYTMMRIPNYFGLFCLIGVFTVSSAYYVYKLSASKGWLGREAQAKYEQQTDGGHGGIGRLILGGRGDSFVGLLACRDKPILGWGPWAIDENDYTNEFLMRFGTAEDVDNIYRNKMIEASLGLRTKLLPCHSYITEFWAWYGIAGLVFWIYVVFIFLRYLKQDVIAVPQWYGWIACSVPAVFWGILFNPFADRFGIPLLIVAALLTRAVRTGRQTLPNNMMKEIEEADRK